MAFYDTQLQKVEQIFESLFCDHGNGPFRGENRSFILSDPFKNLWPGIIHDALAYFKENNITWWDSGDRPTNHPLSSQIACINHLYPIRQREDMASALLSKIDPSIVKAVTLNTGFVEFEMTGKEKLGGERILKRGANCTSIDAMMLGETVSGQRILFLIEWKYVENYKGKTSKLETDGGEVRFENYIKLLETDDCPIIHPDKKDLFTEPFYQLMRQTLLGWEMVRRSEFEADNWQHVIAIPTGNVELRNSTISSETKGDTLESCWKKCLKEPEKFTVIDPEEWFSSLKDVTDTRSVLTYLGKRYWA